jgi:hypothetical protein
MDATLYEALSMLVALLAAVYVLVVLCRGLSRNRPGLALTLPVLTALGVRVVAAAGVSLTGLERSLRGGDEIAFLSRAHTLVEEPLTDQAWVDTLTGSLHEFVFAVQLRLFGDIPDLSLRITHAAIAVAGLTLMAAAVYELAGPRAAVISMWVLALEPTNVFFSTLLHKESVLLLAEGLVVFGGARMRTRGQLPSIGVMALGCAMALATRPYAGWFLIAASALVLLNTARHHVTFAPSRALALLVIVGAVAAATVPTVINASSERLSELQGSQQANTNDTANLSLEQVDFSSPGAVLRNLPQRLFDVTFRPFPWQIQNASQRLGVIGGLLVLFLLAQLVRFIVRERSRIMDRAGPFIYTAGLLLVAYSLSSGNAGTSFRYRTHVVALAICAIVILRVRSAEEAEVVETSRDPARARPLTADMRPSTAS